MIEVLQETKTSLKFKVLWFLLQIHKSAYFPREQDKCKAKIDFFAEKAQPNYQKYSDVTAKRPKPKPNRQTNQPKKPPKTNPTQP